MPVSSVCGEGICLEVCKIVLSNITHVVMSGAHTGDIEFRITEIKDLLRYWYKMLFIATTNFLAKIKHREDTIWGSTSVASKIGLYGSNSSEPTKIKLGNGKRWRYLNRGYPAGSKIYLHVVVYEDITGVVESFFQVFMGFGIPWRYWMWLERRLW